MNELLPTSGLRIAAIIDHRMPEAELAALPARGASLVELRIDLLPLDFDAALAYAKIVKNCTGLPLLGTLRETPENKAERAAQFGRLVAAVDMIDIEIDTAIRDEVIAAAKAAGCRVIVSEHDYAALPSNARLDALVAEAHAAGADIFKIAAAAATKADAARLMCFCAEQTLPIIAIAMGPAGTATRACAPLFGSLFSYAFTGNDLVAPGQLGLDELASCMRILFPEQQ